MHLYHLAVAVLLCLLVGVFGEPQPYPDAAKIQDILEQGKRYRHQLQLEKSRLYEGIKAFDPDQNAAALYRLAGVKLDDFAAFEDLVFGMIHIYDRTVSQRPTATPYDFRTPALKLTFDFQLAIKESHEHLQSNSLEDLDLLSTTKDKNSSSGGTRGDAREGDSSREALKEMLRDMLQEVRQNADQLEKGMHRHHLAFPSVNSQGATIETVLKLSEEDHDVSEDNGAILIDQDNNEYIMMRPSDTTVIYEDTQLLHDFILIVVSSYVLGWIFCALGLPAFFGYISAGIITGPSGYNLIEELIQTETLAQLGVVFIVFVLGLEFSPEKLRAMWRLALGGAIMILAVTVLFFVIMGTVLGATMKEAIFVGACVSLSSTAVVVKCIKLDHLEHLYGLLVMQDVLLGFMLAIVPALAEPGVQVIFAVFKISVSFTIFGLVCFAFVKAMPPLARVFRRALPKKMAQHNHELMLLGSIAICLVMLVISERLDLGMEIGCFAAGVIIRSRKNLFEMSIAVIEPVRDLFACLFFASIGLHVYPSFLASEAMLLLTLAAGVIGFKYMTTSVVLMFLKLDLRTSSTMAIALAQISEFGFVLASRAKQLDIISREVYYLLLGITSLTLLSTPLLWKLMDRTALLATTTTSSSGDPSSTTHHHHHHHHHHRASSRHHLDEHPIVSISLDDADKFA